MRLCTLVVLLGTWVTCRGLMLEQETCDVNRMTVDHVPNADAIIGGIFDIRRPSSDGYGCGAPDPETIMAYEAARWSVDRINSNNFINGVTMGMRGYDSCYSTYRAVAAANHFYPQYSSMMCNETNQIKLGIVGTMSSWTSKPVAGLTAKFPASMISSIAASPSLSDKTKYPYFMRTAPSASEQAKSMMAAMNLLSWERVVVVYEDNDYGRDSMQEFVRLSQQKDICVVATIALPMGGDRNTFATSLTGISSYDVIGAVAFASQPRTVTLLQAIEQVSNTGDMQWMVSSVYMNRQVREDRMRGVIYVQPQFTEVTEFYNYFTNPSSLNPDSPPAANPWFRDWFMETFNCRLRSPDADYPPYVSLSDCTPKTSAQRRAAINTRYAFVDSTIKAVYAYAAALRSAHQALCGGIQGMCSGLRSMTAETFHNNYLSNVDFDMSESGINTLSGMRVRFDANGDFYTAGHDYWNFNNQPGGGSFAWEKVGTYVDDVLNLVPANIVMYDEFRITPLGTLPSSLCPDTCRNCVVPRNAVNFHYKPGDLVLTALFDIHAAGKEVLSCGDLQSNEAISVAAFRFAIERLKTQFPNILPGVELGSLVVDLCNNGENGRLLLNSLLGQRAIISDRSGQVIDPNQVKGVVSTSKSGSTMSLAEMLGHFHMPVVASSATSIHLSDRQRFPTFSRVLPSDYHQMNAFVLLLKRMNWNYVQVIYANNNYGRSAFEIIKSSTAKKSICIAAAHTLESGTDYASLITRMQQKPNAKAVIMVGDSPSQYRALLTEIQNQGLKGQFILLGSETWGTVSGIETGLESVAEGSITIDIVGSDLTAFTSWLNGMNPANPDVFRENPFLAEWYQYAYNCYLNAQNRGRYTVQCNPNNPITQAPRFKLSPYVSFAIMSTYTAARAIDQTLRDVCGDANGNYNGICWQFRSSPDTQQRILSYIQNANFDLNGYNVKIENGEGLANYRLYSYNGGTYQELGTYRTGAMELDLQMTPVSLPPSFTSECTSCSECVYLIQNRPFEIIDGKDLKIGVNFALSNPGTDPFICSDVRLTNGVQSYLALAYAISQVNEGKAPVSLSGVEVGALVMDHCNSPARAYGLPSALYAGILESSSQSEPYPNLNTIRAWMTDNTLVTQQMKEFFTDFNLPVISPMATTNTFLNDEEYPTFIRTVQGDSTIASALAVLAKSLNLLYVNVLYSDTMFGRAGMDTFETIARQEGLCIVNMVAMDNSRIDDIVAELLTQPSHVVVTYLGAVDMDRFLSARGRNNDGQQLVILSPEPYPLVYLRQGQNANRVLSLRTRTNTLTGYLQFVENLRTNGLLNDNPFLRAYYMELFMCNLPGEFKYNTDCGPLGSITTRSNFFVDNYVLPIVNAMYTFVAASDETLKIQCGQDYSGVCANFYSDPNTNSILLDKLTEVVFEDESGSTFDFIGKEGNTGREIVLFNNNVTMKVANFAGASIEILDRNLRNSFAGTRATCTAPCTSCISNTMDFTYLPGDILLGGIFDVHKSALTAFSCGDINTLRGFQLLEAFHFAINKVNDKDGQFANVLKNIKLGGIGLDACQSSVRGGYLVSNIYNGLTKLERNDMIIDPDMIDAYVATYSSTRSIYLARLMKSIKMPQISYGSTSMTLNDEKRYPYFLRAVPADDRQAKGMVDFLRKFDIRYVQVVHTADNYGEQGAAIFNKVATENKICVSQTVSFQDKTDVTIENANDIVLDLLQKPVANTVIVFADSSHINELLQAIRRNPDAHNKFKFIGSDSWANNVESTDGVEDIALGSVAFDLDVVDLREFDEYLASKTPANYPENPWFPEYYEEIQNCYLTIPTDKYPRRCSATPENIVTSQRYKQDTGIIHVINSVYAAAYGIDAALKDVCGSDYTTVCEQFKNADNRHELVLNKTRDASFMDLSNQQFSFYDRGDGKKGYSIFSIEQSPIYGYTYDPIGKFSSEGVLSMTRLEYAPSWDGSCDRPDSCTECPTVRNLRPRYMFSPSSDPDAAKLIFTAAIHGQGMDEYRCGDMDLGMMLQALAVDYTLRYTSSLLDSGSRFGLQALILDNCDNQLRIDQDLFNIFTKGQLCNENYDWGGSIIDASTIAGVHTTSSRYVVAANRVTTPFKIQLMSHYATSTALSLKWRYPYFARTVPPDNKQMEAIAQILKANGWTYFGVLYSLEAYGISGFRDLQSIVNEGGYACIGVAQGIPYPNKGTDLRDAVRAVAETQGVNAIVLITFDPRPVLEAIKAEGLASRFVVIGTDSWGNVEGVSEGLARDFAGAITVTYPDADYDPFINHITRNFNYTQKLGMPNDWFEEFYQHIHQCYLPDAEIVLNRYTKECTKREQLTADQVRSYRVGIHPLLATYAVANALKLYLREYSCGQLTFAQCMAKFDNSRDRLFNKTLEQTKRVLSVDTTPSEVFNFELGDDRFWNVGYNVFALRNSNNYDLIGSVRDDVLTYNKTLYERKVLADNPDMLQYEPVVSKCPEDTVCNCVIEDAPQPQAQTVAKYMRDHEPRNYFMYDNDTGEQVYTWPIWAIAVAVVTCIGLLVGLLLFCYFLVFYPVMGGTTVLGFMMMIGVFGIYAVNFTFFLPAAAATCGAREFVMGVVYAIAIAPLLVKSVDNWRFKDIDYSPHRYHGLTNPVALVLISLGIILIQCIIPIEWLILRPPSASLMADSTTQHDWMWCDPHDFYDISLVLSFVFVKFLVLLTAIFAALSWDSENNYYESRWIFVSCVCTAGCFLVWMVVSTNAGPPYRDPAVAIANFANATALLVLIPLRKFVLLCKFSAEEEKAKSMPLDDDHGEMYSTVYSNQMYQPDVYQTESKPSSEHNY